MLIPVDSHRYVGGHYIIKMQRYEMDLVEYMEQAQLDAAQYKILWNDISSALHYLHTRQLVHRDVKPENILVGDGHFLLCDFNLSQPSNTTVTSIAGSDVYIAPEFWTMSVKDLVPADIWSLGVTLLAVATGRQLWAKATRQDQFFRRFMNMSTDLYVCKTLKRFTSAEFRDNTKHLVCILVHMLHMRPDCRPSAASIRMVSSSLCL